MRQRSVDQTRIGRQFNELLECEHVGRPILCEGAVIPEHLPEVLLPAAVSQVIQKLSVEHRRSSDIRV